MSQTLYFSLSLLWGDVNHTHTYAVLLATEKYECDTGHICVGCAVQSIAQPTADLLQDAMT